ncbi:MAG: GtrA family protein [Patescibacteria group bacterium]
MQVLRQIIKFVIVGISNTLCDLAVLNLLIFLTAIASGLPFTVFKGISFLVAVGNSYFWNKHWTFHSNKKVFFQFLTIATVGLFLNVGTASLLVNVVGPQFGLSQQVWANIGAIGGTLVVMTWNFTGYKFLVFQK